MIASVNSIAIGKGFELSLFCDIIVVIDDTLIGYYEMCYGISDHCMFLPWLVNIKTAKDLLLTGCELTAAEAKEMGLVTEVVPLEGLKKATHWKALLMARMPRDVQRLHKMYLNRVYEMQGLKTATDYYLEQVAIMGANPVPEYEAFSKSTVEMGLRQL